MDVHYEQNIKGALDDAWAVVADFGSLLNWVNGGDEGTISLSGEGVGMLRDFTLPSVGAVQHRLDQLDHENHRFTYTLTKGKPLGMAAYSVTLTLTENGAGGCFLSWDGEFTPDEGAPAEQMAEGLRTAYQDMSTRLEALITS